MKTINEDKILLGCAPDQALLHGVLAKNEGYRFDDAVGRINCTGDK